jgi:hypothetical protein
VLLYTEYKKEFIVYSDTIAWNALPYKSLSGITVGFSGYDSGFLVL